MELKGSTITIDMLADLSLNDVFAIRTDNESLNSFLFKPIFNAFNIFLKGFFVVYIISCH